MHNPGCIGSLAGRCYGHAVLCCQHRGRAVSDAAVLVCLLSICSTACFGLCVCGPYAS